MTANYGAHHNTTFLPALSLPLICLILYSDSPQIVCMDVREGLTRLLFVQQPVRSCQPLSGVLDLETGTKRDCSITEKMPETSVITLSCKKRFMAVWEYWKLSRIVFFFFSGCIFHPGLGICKLSRQFLFLVPRLSSSVLLGGFM